MLTLGGANCKSFLTEAQSARCIGLLLDDLTDIAVQEQMMFHSVPEPESKQRNKIPFYCQPVKW